MVTSRTGAWGEHFVGMMSEQTPGGPDEGDPLLGENETQGVVDVGAPGVGRGGAVSPALLLSRALHRACSSPQQILVHQNDMFCTTNTK